MFVKIHRDPSTGQKYTWRWCILLLQKSHNTSFHHQSPFLFSFYKRYGNTSSSLKDSWLDGGVSGWQSSTSRYSCTCDSETQHPTNVKVCFWGTPMQIFTFTLVDPDRKISESVTLKLSYSSYLIGSDGKNAFQIFDEFSKCGSLVWLVTPAVPHQHITATHTSDF
jgi:hypothetical protein